MPTTPDREARGFSFALEMAERRDGKRLELRAVHRENYGAISADWSSSDLMRRIAAGRRQPLARAVGLHRCKAGDPPLQILDATAGLGRDGYTLAALGAVLTLAERQPQTLALLEDARRRALAQAAQRAIASRIEILEIDARQLCADPENRDRWQVIYLDPMYPDDGKAALPSKELQILRDLTGGDDDAGSLLAPALACATQRVVVKRPAKAPWLAGLAPSTQIVTTQLRFDIYIRSSL